MRVCRVKDQNLAVAGVSSGRKQIYLTDDLGMADQDSIYQLVAICYALNIKEGPSYFTKNFQKPALLNDIGQKKSLSTKWT